MKLNPKSSNDVFSYHILNQFLAHANNCSKKDALFWHYSSGKQLFNYRSLLLSERTWGNYFVEFPCHLKFMQIWLDDFIIKTKLVWQLLINLIKILIDFLVQLGFVLGDWRPIQAYHRVSRVLYENRLNIFLNLFSLLTGSPSERGFILLVAYPALFTNLNSYSKIDLFWKWHVLSKIAHLTKLLAKRVMR